VWAHHLYVTGQILLPFFAIMTMLIAVPTGVKFFNWIGTMWGGSLTFHTPIWALGFLDDLPLRRHHGRHDGQPGDRLPHLRHLLHRGPLPLHDLRHRGVRDVRRLLLLVAEAHRPHARRALGKIHFWMLFIGFHTTFLVQHLLGIQGMARRYADYLPEEGFRPATSSRPSARSLLGASMLPFLYNVWKTWRTAPLVTVDDPWGYGNSLEWATSCPPPRHNFNSLPRIRSERPAFDLHHPEAAPAGVHDAAVADDNVLVSALGPADLGGNAFADEKKEG
jgi:cytochrome c oxidase subunit 1